MLSQIHNFSLLYAFILILISYSYYSYSKFKVLIELILTWFRLSTNHKINMILKRILQYSQEGCVFAVFVSIFLLFFFCNFWWMIWITRIICKYYKYFSKFMNLNEQTYESNIFRMVWVQFNVVLIFIATRTSTYKLMLHRVRMIQSR